MQEIENIISSARHVADDRGNGGSGNPPVECQDHNRVQDHIEQISQNLTCHRLIGLPFCPEDIGIADGNQDKGTTQSNDGQVGFCRFPGIRTGSNQRQNLIHKKEKRQGHDNSYRHASPHTEGTHFLCIFSPSLPKGAGNDRGSSNSENSANRHKDKKNRRSQGHRRHQNIAVGLGNKKGVRQIVNQDHQHSCHSGERVFQYRLGYRCFLKKVHGIAHNRSSSI